MDVHNEFWINGVRERSDFAADRGLEFGDGLFETMRYHQGKLIALDFHLKRLAIGLKRLYFPDCISRVKSDLNVVIAHLISASCKNVIVRLTVTRGAGARGYEPTLTSSINIIIKSSVIESSSTQQNCPIKVGISNFRLSVQPVLAGIKHTNRLEQILASLERRKRGLDELLLLDLNNIPISFIAGNLFIREYKTLLTPKLESNGIQGTRRHLILSQLAAECGYSALESNLSKERILSADEIIFCNAVQGVRSISQLDNSQFTDYSAARSLHDSYTQGYLK